MAYIVIMFLMTLPLLVVITTSLTPSGILTFPPKEISLRWYGEFLDSPIWLRAFRNSLIIATGTMIFSTLIGTMAAFGVVGLSKRAQGVLIPLFLLPMLVPGVVLGITLLMFMSRFDLQATYPGVIVGHSLWATPLVFFLMHAVLSRFDWSLREAGMDLGASQTQVFIEIILPGVKRGVFASAFIAFIISLQEFLLALFLTGSDTVTVPVLAWNALRQQVSPMISVVSTLLLLSVIVFLIPAAISFGFERLARHL